MFWVLNNVKQFILYEDGTEPVPCSRAKLSECDVLSQKNSSLHLNTVSVTLSAWNYAFSRLIK